MDLTEWLSNLDKQVPKDVEKYLGKKPDLPDGSGLVALSRKFDEASKKYAKALETMKGDLGKAGSSYDKALAELKKAIAEIGTETFGLDGKDKSVAKQIADARKLYVEELNKLTKTFDGRKDSLKEFTKAKGGNMGSATAAALA